MCGEDTRLPCYFAMIFCGDGDNPTVREKCTKDYVNRVLRLCQLQGRSTDRLSFNNLSVVPGFNDYLGSDLFESECPNCGESPKNQWHRRPQSQIFTAQSIRSEYASIR